ncbi:hypothetical protein DVR12_09465 [Chitinophaga silvatica]|uniref:Uncharacterized protein n=1 Tax=Chitinophaga silvatica TaxID=2282649 RepID=A0A3E1YB42_9BACT|nr:hypothetical protein [Chitinophaga silvatica]RFS23238.1 hypothetical protein DVR12_09465 [Chitinophaga silvatica]
MSHELNISNYESWFLSYVDGELNEEEVTLLQQFLLKYPHLQQELELLEGTKLTPDTDVVFDHKAVLYKQNIDSEAYTDLMLSYIDGELDDVSTEKLLQYVNTTTEAEKELTIFRQAKLTPDSSIVFGDKSSLYRRSAKTGTIYRRIGWSAAIAAVVAGFIVWVLPTHQPEVPVTAPNIASVTTVTPNAVPVPVPNEEATPTLANVEPAKAKTVAQQKLQTHKLQGAQDKQAEPEKSQVGTLVQLPPQRNAVEEVVTEHLQQVASAAAEPISGAEIKKETILATSTQIVNKNIEDNKPVVTSSTQTQPPGELIISVSGSDSKILDKVTNVAKLFSRRRK